MQFGKRSALLAIAVGGLIAGALDITQAIILFGKKVPLLIAAGLLGKGALHGGGAGTYALGLFLHFFIAMSVATIYYVASRRLRFMMEHWLICGLFYGAAVDQVMTLIVFAIVRASRRGSVQTSRLAPRHRRPQHRDRPPHLFQCSTLCQIAVSISVGV